MGFTRVVKEAYPGQGQTLDKCDLARDLHDTYMQVKLLRVVCCSPKTKQNKKTRHIRQVTT